MPYFREQTEASPDSVSVYVFCTRHYSKHVGAFFDLNSKGITLIDQYKGREYIDQGFIRFGGTPKYNSDTSHYFVVLVPDSSPNEGAVWAQVRFICHIC